MLGGIERIIALILFLYRPDQLPWFIGAWVGLKFAANWKRYPAPMATSASRLRPDPRSAEKRVQDAAEGSLLFLIGNAISFGIAIGAAVLLQQWLDPMLVAPKVFDIAE
jgi:hypothetical protein